MRKSIITLLAAAATFTGLSGVAHSQETIKLKMATFLPATQFQVVHGSQVWMDEVKRLTNGKVEFEYYPAQQLGKAAELMDLMLNGVIDVAEVAPAYVTGKLPLMGVLEMPGVVKTSCEGAAAMRSLATPGGTIYDADYKPNGVMPLTFFIYPPYSVVSREPIKSIEDFAGKKLRTSGGAMELVAGKLGGTSVRMPSPEIYQSLQRGTIDAVMFSFLSAEDSDLDSVARYGVTGYGFGAPSVVVTMADKKFKSLPQDIQDALVKAGPVADQSFCDYVDTNDAATLKKFVDEGMEMFTLSDADKAKLDEELAPIAADWAKGLDERGKPATKAFEEFSAANSQN